MRGVLGGVPGCDVNASAVERVFPVELILFST